LIIGKYSVISLGCSLQSKWTVFRGVNYVRWQESGYEYMDSGSERPVELENRIAIVRVL